MIIDPCWPPPPPLRDKNPFFNPFLTVLRTGTSTWHTDTLHGETHYPGALLCGYHMIVWRGFNLMHAKCDASKAELLIEVASNDGGSPKGMIDIILKGIYTK